MSRCGSSIGAAFERGTSTEKCEPRPTGRLNIDRGAEHARHALDDRQAETEPARDLGALIEPVELDEDVAPLGLRDADAGVVDVDAQMLAAPPAADQHAARRRVFDGVGDEILDEPPQQPAVGAHHQRAGHEGEFDAARAGASGANSSSICRISSSMRKLRNSGRNAPVSSRDMSSSAPKISSTASSEASILSTSARVLAAALALDQAGDVEPRRVERLQDVVARRGEELGLGNIGGVGLALGAGERGVEPRQLLGALLHAPLQRLVGALQRFGRFDAGGDVGEGGDDAAVRHAVGAHLDHQPRLGETLQERLGAGDVKIDLLADERVDALGTDAAAPGVEAQDVGKADADAG